MTTNRILAGMPPGERYLILPSLEHRELHLGEGINHAGEP